MNRHSRRLLILACSCRKRLDPGLLPAVERYDGPAFRLYRRYLRREASAPLDVYVLSAEFGLVRHDTPIPNYDRRMTNQRAGELRSNVVAELRRLVSDNGDSEVFVLAGRAYLSLIQDREREGPGSARVHIASGPIGRKLSELYDWLYGAPPTITTRNGPTLSDAVRLRDVAITATADQILELARTARADARGQPLRYQSWYVPIDGCRVAPKWLVAHLTGLPPARFGTTEALRVLQRLSIPVLRV